MIKKLKELKQGDFEVTENGIEVVKALSPDKLLCTTEVLIPKNIFIEAYNKYIKEQK